MTNKQVLAPQRAAFLVTLDMQVLAYISSLEEEVKRYQGILEELDELASNADLGAIQDLLSLWKRYPVSTLHDPRPKKRC